MGREREKEGEREGEKLKRESREDWHQESAAPVQAQEVGNMARITIKELLRRCLP